MVTTHHGMATRSRQQSARRRPDGASGAIMMAFDPTTVDSVHSVAEHVNILTNSGVDETWLVHVLQGERWS